MRIMYLFLFSLIAGFAGPCFAAEPFVTDRVPTVGGELGITFIGHGSLMLTWKGQNIQIDPNGQLTDYAAFPKADLVLVTHEHGDHLDMGAFEKIRKASTQVILPEACAEKIPAGSVMKNGERRELMEMVIEAVPAYNLVHKRDDGQPFHPKGRGNGYILNCGDAKIYIAGDTENTPEMKALKDIAIAFLPMNLPYTMTPEMVADAAKAFRPKILYPYHFGKTDLTKLQDLMKSEKDIEIRLRKME